VRRNLFSFILASRTEALLRYLKSYYDHGLLNTTKAYHALEECMKVKGVSRLASQVSLAHHTGDSEARYESSCLCDYHVLPDVLSSKSCYDDLCLSVSSVHVYISKQVFFQIILE